MSALCPVYVRLIGKKHDILIVSIHTQVSPLHCILCPNSHTGGEDTALTKLPKRRSLLMSGLFSCPGSGGCEAETETSVRARSAPTT
jgi:hypothetical protein